jgi:hypothetical protein
MAGRTHVARVEAFVGKIDRFIGDLHGKVVHSGSA